MKILKASAGSGKTYRLSRKYRDIILNSEDRYAFRHILAVTFTNKATAEMKARILKDLAKDAATKPKAQRVLSDILHDYSSFAVSTIDKFFQRALKAFSREIGQFSDYQVELDRDAVICEAMDRVLDSITEEDRDVLEWVRLRVESALKNGERVNLEDGLYSMGKLLKNDEHRQLLERYGLEDTSIFNKERLTQIRKSCEAFISDFKKECLACGLSEEAVEVSPIKRPGVRALKANQALSNLFEEKFRAYNTAYIISEMIFSLGLAGEFYARFDEILKEKNIMCLDESYSILKDIINGSDAPFVYEKLGVRFRDFLLDEFQDTSEIQWDNFLPLLKESESGDESHPADNLIVGDVKQSIYRWRNSDWRLLGERVNREFPRAEVEPLDCNWRSCAAIVDFNNDFFNYAAAKVGASSIYSDVRQEARAQDGQCGCVKVTFTDSQIDEVLSSIESAVSRGAGYSDIAVLVRGNSEGSIIADSLIEKGIPVISNDSLDVKSSLTVRRLASLMNCIDSPDDAVGNYLGASLGVELPERYLSIFDLCESLLRELMKNYGENISKETAFIHAFEDEIQSWTKINGNDLRGFLSHWNDGSFHLSSPETGNAVTIITIHKSKGLQFPHVIFPFAEKVKRYRNETHWCRLDTTGTILDKVLSGIYPVNLSSRAADSYFSEDYDNEVRMQNIDNLNIFYVALTRAEKSLHIIAASPSKKCADAVAAHKEIDFTLFSEMLYAFCEGFSERSFGEPYNFNLMKRDVETLAPRQLNYSSTPLGSRLSPSDDAFDFFGDDGETGPETSFRLRGVALHNILSKVNLPSDLESAVNCALLNGEITQSMAEDARKFLQKRIEAHPQWFCSIGSNEISIADTDGSIWRPDRVIERDGTTVIVDYKFGSPQDKYKSQVARYVRLYQKMGRKDVRGYLWYVYPDKVVEV